MRQAYILAAALALLVTGCGSVTGHGAGGDRRLAFAGCPAASPAVRSARPLLQLDLDGNGRPDTVRVTSRHAGRCRDALVVTLRGRTTGVSLKATGVDRGSAVVVQPHRGTRQLLFVTGLPHPRGGYQPYLIGLGAGRLGQVNASGNPVLPFVATDGGGAPATAMCTPVGGIAMFSASPHRPVGVVLAWDLMRTTYLLHGLSATPVSSHVVRSAVADPTLRKEMPDLFRPTFFGDCAAR